MLTQIHNIVEKLNKDNTIFGNNGKYLNDLFEFKNNGITDKLVNHFYIRPINLNPKKYKLSTNVYGVGLQSAMYRAVFQLYNVNTENAIKSLLHQLSQIPDITIINYSDDATGIHFAEYNIDKTPPGILISIDFILEIESALQYCECLTLENIC